MTKETLKEFKTKEELYAYMSDHTRPDYSFYEDPSVPEGIRESMREIDMYYGRYPKVKNHEQS